MLSYYPVVLVADVIDVRVESVNAFPPGIDLSAYPTVEGKPAVSSVRGSPISIYTLNVVESITSESPKPGAPATFVNDGGFVSDASGKIERWGFQGDELLEVRGRYLMFVVPSKNFPNTFVAAPWGKFRIENGQVIAPEPWSKLGVSMAVVGDLDKATAKVSAARPSPRAE
ncbi:MAG TPA: hypothetical protein VIH21_04315 [Dehalococcoidia bacterium]|jgi:hypothetical protein